MSQFFRVHETPRAMTFKEVLAWIKTVGTPATSKQLLRQVHDPDNLIERTIAIGDDDSKDVASICTTTGTKPMDTPQGEETFPPKSRFLVLHKTGDTLPKKAETREIRTFITTHQMKTREEVLAWVEETCFIGDNDDLLKLVIRHPTAAEGVISVYIVDDGYMSKGTTANVEPLRADGPFPIGTKVVVAFIKNEVNVVEAGQAD